jgi:hypothetical protein
LKLIKLLPNTFFENKALLSAWCFVAALGSYFCMYAYRKPFAAGLYQGVLLWGLSYKSVLIVSQVLGYMCSKYLGIRVVSELKPHQRIGLIVLLISIAQLALIGFALVPAPYSWPFLFINGLPLGMVWGVIFSFLEGRRITEFVSVGLSINLVVGSGFLKSIYLFLKNSWPLSEYWLPATIGFMFIPIFCFFIWMLEQIPAPSIDDTAARSKRLPMTSATKNQILQSYGLGLWAIVIIYVFFTTIRDYRDNFSIEIWQALGLNIQNSSFAIAESYVGMFTMLLLFSVGFIKHNHLAYRYINLLILLGLLACGLSTYMFQYKGLPAYTWQLCIAVSFFTPYLLVQTLYFERLIAVLRLQANVGFFVYICDSLGYTGSLFMVLSKEFFFKNTSHTQVLVSFSYIMAVVGSLLWLQAYLFFKAKIPYKTLATNGLQMSS